MMEIVLFFAYYLQNFAKVQIKFLAVSPGVTNCILNIAKITTCILFLYVVTR